ncbi:SusC/RagA family TonB-linked outer membrane protein [Larkinella insperata]|uniref:SusC/RagA family TonB-linked outer membrane protein n=1 Tax=Larkinella insperata TaxID=332158 RepID=A0ABW3QDF3_9BACT|nr:TonB-dependent receptor [Larkinella insperata]
MKIYLKSRAAACAIIAKRFLIQLITSGLLTGINFANTVFAQDVFQRTVSLSIREKGIKDVLAALESKAGVKFVYSSHTLAKRKVSLDILNRPLPEALEEVFKPARISSKVVGGQVVINLETPLAEPVKTAPKTQTADERRITGTVKDEKGEGLPGVSVVIKNTQRGTATDAEGKYSLALPDGEPVLVFSFVGYLSQEVPVGNQTLIDIELKADAKGLDEVVVVGYGTQKIANVTGSVASIGSKEVKSIPTSNLVTGLAGRLPGLRVTQSSSEPGSYNTRFDIRGFGNPLIVVDGLVMDAINFARINPNDIAEITVLKDASAAIYGVKSANGVILVTTKKGEPGKPKISYSGFYQVNKVTNTPTPYSAYEFAVISTENEINTGRAPGSTTFSREDLEKYRDGTYPSTNWYDLVMRDFTPMKNHTINVSGGSDRIKYFTSLGYVDEMGLWKSGDLNYKKYNIRSNVTSEITKNLEAVVGIDALLDNKNEPGAPAYVDGGIGGTYFSLFMQNPTVPVYANNNPQYLSDTYDGQHPLAITHADMGGYTKTRNKTFQGSFTLNYKVPAVPGLSAKFMYGFYNQDRFMKAWRPKFLMYTYNKETDTYINSSTKNNPPNMTEDYSTFQRTTVLGQVTYDRVFKQKHGVKAALVFEERHEMADNMWAKKEFSLNVDQLFAGLSKNAQVNSSNIYENDNQNVIGRLNYDYQSKYLFEFGFNYGGSSKFPRGKRWGFFPYASAGWRISDEEFFKNALPYVSNLKLRGSWGEMGDDGASSFQFLTGYTYPSGNYFFGDGVVSGLGFRGIPNPNITWYTVTSKNIGLDLDINNGLINMQLDLFQRDRSGLLGTRIVTIPGTVGANLPQENLNKDLKRGFELVLGHAKRNGVLRYSVSGNVTYTRGRASYIERVADANSYLNWRSNMTNRWDNISWGYRYIGQFQTQEEIFNSPLQDNQGNKTMRPGDLKYEDVNKDGIINDLDIVPIGRGNVPDINFGLSGSLTYKQFDANMLFQGASNFNFNFQGTWYMGGPLTWAGRNALSYFMDRWHHEDLYDVNSPWVPGRFPSTGYPASNKWNSAFWLQDAKYLRLKSMEIGYTFKESLLSRIGAQNVRLYVSGFNLFTWTKLKYVDPERNTELTYPITKNYNLGVNITF